MNNMADQQFPDDVIALKKLLLEAFSANNNLSDELGKKTKQIHNLEETIRYLKHLKFGRSTEKFSSTQGDLFNEAELLSEDSAAIEETGRSSDKKTVTKNRARSKPRTLQQLPDDIQRNEVFHDLPEHEKHCSCSCSCGCQLVRSGTERSEQLEVVPPKFSVTVHIRHTYACKHCDGQLKTATKPAQPIEKSFASSSLLAYIIVSKYLYALPIHRQEKIYESLKVPLKRNTMATWVINSEIIIAPLLKRFEYYLLKERYIQCDETRTQVLNEPNKRPDQVSQMWVRRSMGDIPITLFNYTETRSGDEACALLAGYSGYLQTDDYAGYNKAVKENGLLHLGCNAHARRKFDEAKKAEPKIKGHQKYTGAELGLLFYKRLYTIEADIKTLTPAERFNTRLTRSIPVFKRLTRWAELKLAKATTKSKLSKALSYLLRNKEKLMMYCCDQILNIDNNLTEGAIRPFVIGRKNWLFSSTPKGAVASAAYYSLVETAKANNVNVFDYLKYLFEKLPQLKSTDDIDDFLPWNVKLPA